MLTKTPFLTGFSTLLCGGNKRKNQDVIADEYRQLKERSLGDISQQFSNEIPAELLHSLSTDRRESVYTNIVVFWAFLAQTIAEEKSCRKAVAKVRKWRAKENLSIPSSDTGCSAGDRRIARKISTKLKWFLSLQMETGGIWVLSRGLLVSGFW